MVLIAPATGKSATRFLKKVGFSEKNLHVVARMNDQESIKNLVAGGLGISIVSEKAVRDYVAVVDIGGQDTKIILLENGTVKDFAMNDKCSAGTGRFLEVMANTMALKPDEVCELARKGSGVTISSMCTVFAESEVISLIGQGEKKENIAYAVVHSIADKVASQCKKLNVQDDNKFYREFKYCY